MAFHLKQNPLRCTTASVTNLIVIEEPVETIGSFRGKNPQSSLISTDEFSKLFEAISAEASSGIKFPSQISTRSYGQTLSRPRSKSK